MSRSRTNRNTNGKLRDRGLLFGCIIVAENLLKIKLDYIGTWEVQERKQ